MSLHVPRSGLLLGAAAAFSLAQAGHAAPPPAGGANKAVSASPPANDANTAVAADVQRGKPRPAEKATSIPEPGSPTMLFLLAAGGLALGRRLSRSRRSPDR